MPSAGNQGYLPDGTPLNAAGNAINHPERMMPDSHAPGSPLPPASYMADIGYLADGTALTAAGNNSVKHVPATASNPTPAPTSAPAASPVAQNTVTHGRGFEYSAQRDAYADQEFTNDVGYLPDGTPMNRAGNAINHPDRLLDAVERSTQHTRTHPYFAFLCHISSQPLPFKMVRVQSMSTLHGCKRAQLDASQPAKARRTAP